MGHHRRATGRFFHAGSGDGDLLFLIEDKNSPLVPPQKIPLPAASWRCTCWRSRQVKRSLGGKGVTMAVSTPLIAFLI
jgi:hypothetical protein